MEMKKKFTVIFLVVMMFLSVQGAGVYGDGSLNTEEGNDAGVTDESPVDSPGEGPAEAHVVVPEEEGYLEYDVHVGDDVLANRAFLRDGIVMVPVREFFEALYLEVFVNDDSISVSSYDMYLYIKFDCRIAFVNAVPFSISTPVEVFDDVLYMPVDLPERMLGMTVEIIEEENKITVGGEINAITEEDQDSLFPPSPVYCTIKSGSGLYKSVPATVKELCLDDTRAQTLMYRSYTWYNLRLDEGKEYWVRGESLIFDDDYELRNDIPTKHELEIYATLKKFESDTDYFIWADLSRQLIYIYAREGKEWVLDKTMLCSTGKNNSPTTRGYYKISDRGEWFYSYTFESGAKYWVRFNENYLFHSIAMDIYQQIKDE